MNKEKTKEIQDEKVNKEPKEEVLEETPVNVGEKEDNGDDSSLENGQDKDDLTSQLAETKDKYLRLYSEFENFRRRTAKERLELTKVAPNMFGQLDLSPIRLF